MSALTFSLLFLLQTVYVLRLLVNSSCFAPLGQTLFFSPSFFPLKRPPGSSVVSRLSVQQTKEEDFCRFSSPFLPRTSHGRLTETHCLQKIGSFASIDVMPVPLLVKICIFHTQVPPLLNLPVVFPRCSPPHEIDQKRLLIMSFLR